MVTHPAKFSSSILTVLAGLVQPEWRILDPFAGTGRVHSLGSNTWGVEIEPEWASMHPRTIVGDALHLPFAAKSFDAVITSPTYANRLADHHEAKDGSVRHSYRHDLGRPLHPSNSGQLQWGCVSPGTLVLRGDLHWVPVESLLTGDKIVGFDEGVDPSLSAGIRQRGRRWRMGYVEEVDVAPRECVEIQFDDGRAVVCTTDHPWLGRRSAGPAGYARKNDWISAGDLRPGDGIPVYMPFFAQDLSYESGWLAGLFDGEGSLSKKGTLSVAQRPGLVLDRLKQTLGDFGVSFRHYVGKGADSLTIQGGLMEIARLLGTVRPERLISKLDINGRGMRTTNIRRVISVTPVGVRPVVLMGTSCSTYLADGMGSHNTKYRQFHEDAWREVRRVLRGTFLLNTSNHVRKGEVQDVNQWHFDTLKGLGFEQIRVIQIPTSRLKFGSYSTSRVEGEVVSIWTL